MKIGGVAFTFLLSLNAFGADVSQLGVKIDPLKRPAPDLSHVKANQVLGNCDGKNYTDQAELDGCERNVHSRFPTTFLPGDPRAPVQPRPVPTSETAH